MSEKITQTWEEIIQELKLEKAKYEQAKEKHPEKWNDKFQEQYDAICAKLTEQEVALAFETPAYVPAKGTEHLVHAKVLRGNRFNPNTGKPVNEPYVQMFSKAEFRVFQESATRLGYKIIEILYQPK